jgi:hypothetical protein
VTARHVEQSRDFTAICDICDVVTLLSLPSATMSKTANTALLLHICDVYCNGKCYPCHNGGVSLQVTGSRWVFIHQSISIDLTII